MNRAYVAGFSLKAFHTLALRRAARPAALGGAGPARNRARQRDRGAAAAQPAPAEPGWLGAELRDLDAASIKALGLDQPHALLVILPAPDGPAEKGGLRTADVIVA